MRAIVLTSLTLGLISFAGCQSNKVAYRVESHLGPLNDANQRLVQIKLFHVDPSGTRVVASPSTFVLQGQEASLNLIMKHGVAFDGRVLFDQAKSCTSVSLSKKGKVFWSTEQTTAMNSEVQSSMTLAGGPSVRSKHDEEVIEALEQILNNEDSEVRR